MKVKISNNSSILKRTDIVEDISSVEEIEILEGVIEIDEECFRGLRKLWKVTLPNSLKVIGDFCFFECSRLQYINLPDGLLSIGVGAFKYTSLMEINIPSSIKCIPEFCFKEVHLKSITIPEGVEKIDDCAFDSCYYLSKVVLPSTLTFIGPESFTDCFELENNYENFKKFMNYLDLEIGLRNFSYYSLIGSSIYEEYLSKYMVINKLPINSSLIEECSNISSKRKKLSISNIIYTIEKIKEGN